MNNQIHRNPIKETVEELKNYLDLQLRYQKMIAAKKMSKLSSFAALFLILFSIAAGFILFFSFAFVWWYSEGSSDKMAQGYLIVTGFYLLLAVITVIFRKSLLINPIRSLLAKLFFEDASSEKGQTNLSKINLKDEEAFENLLLEEKKQIRDKEEQLQKKFKEVEQQFTFTNMVKMAVENLVSSYVTTATVTKLAFKAFANLRHKRKRLKK
jgi:ABC-type multidrug transport system fused ATPase/permease subunit